MTWIFLILFFGILIFLILRKRSEIKSTSAQTWKFFFPSWRFFENLGLRYSIWTRESSDHSWVRLKLPVARSSGLLWSNPNGNLQLAFDSILEQFVSELAEDSAIPQILFELIDKQARFLVETLHLPASPTREFCLTEHPQGSLITSPQGNEIFRW